MYDFPFLPAGVLPRAIVRLLGSLEPLKLWLTGCIVKSHERASTYIHQDVPPPPPPPSLLLNASVEDDHGRDAWRDTIDGIGAVFARHRNVGRGAEILAKSLFQTLHLSPQRVPLPFSFPPFLPSIPFPLPWFEHLLMTVFVRERATSFPSMRWS